VAVELTLSTSLDDRGHSPQAQPLDFSPLAWAGCGLGVVAVAAGDALARHHDDLSGVAFWLGLALIGAPPVWTLLSPRPARRLRLATVSVLASALYLADVFQSANGFVLHDEFGWLRATSDVLATRHLFSANPLVANFGSFPGLSGATATIQSLTGLSSFAAGTTLIGIGRLVFVVLLFLTVERVTGSDRVAGVATVVYMTNPSYFQFDAQFSYESLALPLALGAIFLVLRADELRSRLLTGTAVATVVAVTATHHMTSYFTTAFLLGWSLIELFRRRRGAIRSPVVLVAAAAVASVLFWYFVVAGTTASAELGPVLRGSVTAIGRLVEGRQQPRHLFASAAGHGNPLWARIDAFSTVGLLGIALLAGLFAIWRERPGLLGPGPLMAALAVLYPFTLILRLTAQGNETAGRTSEFVFVGLGLIAALAMVELKGRRARGETGAEPEAVGPAPIRYAALTVVTVVALVGGVVIGTAPYARQPGPYLVGADPRSVDPAGISAARWLAANVTPGTRVAADLTDTELITGYSRATPVSGAAGGHPVADLYLSRSWTATDQEIVAGGRLSYVVVDNRICQALPLVGHYFAGDEPAAGYRSPPSCSALEKFSGLPGVSEVFGDGPVHVYRLSRTGGPV
jgi:hypothetical protein